MKVKAWSEKVVIPTYEIGKPEKNPVFLEKRVYQGSSGSVYPYPVVEKISDEKVDKEWQACWLENDYLKIMILPELGGRIQMAWDKTMQRHFVYYNHVIKPALVGLTGPWISGGIEFNWPQHHRPSTYLPVDYRIVENPDGSMTVWCSEIEQMFHTRGMAGFTLNPGKAYLEISVRLANRTPQPQTFLWWANPAVKVNDDYQSVFPPDVHAVFDHGKRDVSRFPIATGTYYKMDYSAGVDISRYKNIPVPTSYMAIRSDYNFVGGYEHDSGGGMLHVANHHVSPGKKQWTWGNGDFGKAWDRNLTDADGPYIELMCGVYTDNQPDFSWLMPYEEKAFTQYFIPYRDLGLVKNASKDALLNLEFQGDQAIVKIYVTGTRSASRIVLKAHDQILLDETADLDPKGSFMRRIGIDPTIPASGYHLTVEDASGRILIEWSPVEEVIRPVPDPARAAKSPEEILNNEQLYLQGIHLEQYRHATYDPEDYYREALNRDPGDVRNNNALGLRFLRRGLFREAEGHFRLAIKTMSERNPNPYDGEPLFNLGMALRYQGKDQEAFDAFFKSVWNSAWMDAGYFQLARIAAARGDLEKALELIDRSLLRNWNNQQARHLKVILLRKLGRVSEARIMGDDSLGLDPFNAGIRHEMDYLNAMGAPDPVEKQFLAERDLHEFVLDYFWSGMYAEGLDMLAQAIERTAVPSPMFLYYKGLFLLRKGKAEMAVSAFRLAEQVPPAYCFPNQLESVLALEAAMAANPEGARAPYYLGNFWYHARQYHRALNCWEQSARLDGSFPTVFRNLALAYYNKFDAPDQARAALEKAFSLDRSDSRIFMELDQLYKKLKWPPEKRLARMEQYPSLVDDRDDQYLERAALYNLTGDHRKAFDLVMNRKFHPWEGGEGRVTGQYQTALVEMSKKAITEGDFSLALELLESARVFPDNLGEGKLIMAQENDIDYWTGCAWDGLGQADKAAEYWERSSTGPVEPSAAWFYNDQQPDRIFYQGMALLRMGREGEAYGRFNRLIDYGEKHLFDTVKIDYFAVSLPDFQIWEDNLDVRNYIHCQYLIGLGQAGKGNHAIAREAFRLVLEKEPAHGGALSHLNLVELATLQSCQLNYCYCSAGRVFPGLSSYEHINNDCLRLLTTIF